MPEHHTQNEAHTPPESPARQDLQKQLATELIAVQLHLERALDRYLALLQA